MTDSEIQSRKDLAAKYNVTVRTIDRWKKTGVLPSPKRIGERPYWTERQIERAEKASVKKWKKAQITAAKRAAKLKKHLIKAVQSVQPTFKF